MAQTAPVAADPPAAPASAAGAEGTTLPAISVRATANQGPTSEKSGTYRPNAVTLFKGERTIREIPQPVTVITRQLIDDRKLIDFHDVMENTPGVTIQYTDSERISFNSRGYSIDALQLDGLTMVQGGSIFIQPDAAVLDRVEILRGASGMLRGSGNPSASVNMVRKRPTAGFQAGGALTIGSWNRRRIEGDLSTPVNEAGTLRARLVAVKDEKEFFQKVKSEDREVFYGVVEADLGPRTLFTASVQHTDLDATGAWGNIPAGPTGYPLPYPRDTYIGADWNRWNRFNDQTFASIEHRFENDWTAKLSAAYSQFRMKDQGFKQTYFTPAPTAANPYLGNLTTSVYTGDASDQRNINLTASGPFTLFGRKHELLVGAETGQVKTAGTVGVGGVVATNSAGVPIGTGIDPRFFDFGSVAEPFPTITAQGAQTRVEQEGVYASTRLSIADPLTVMAGARASWWKNVGATAAATYGISREITPYVGAVWDFSPQLSAYASYTEIFTPQNVRDINGRYLDPITGEDYELGVKGEFFDKRLNAQFSLFRINNVGRAVIDTTSPANCPSNIPLGSAGQCRIAGGKTRSQGFEFDLTGELWPRLQVSAGYTNTRTQVIRDPSATTIGQPLRSQDPRHLLRLFSTYAFGGELQGLKVGGGVQAQSESYLRSTTLTAYQGGRSVWNAMASYRFNKHYAVQLNVNNVFDKYYFKQTALTGISNYYGDPRNVLVTLRGDF